MHFRDFLGQVQNRAHLSSLEDALRVTKSTLTTLGERLAGREPHKLAAQLPREFHEYLTPDGAHPAPHRFDVHGFIARVAEREQVTPAVATYHVRVVLEVLSEAVSPALIEHVKAQLPQDFCRLFDAGSQGSMRGADL